MRKLTGFIVFSCLFSQLYAQAFQIEYPKKKDRFAFELISILNDAPFKFQHIKGKLLAKTDSIHLESQIFQVKQVLNGATLGRYVQDSTFYVEYFFGEYTAIEQGRQAQKELTQKISKALNRKVVVLTNDWGNDNNTIIENKLAYCMHNGFFHYNMVVQLNKVMKRDAYRLVFQVYYGRPNYYYWIMRNEPVGSFNFTLGMKNVMMMNNNQYSKGCPIEIPPLLCNGKFEQHDTSFIEYKKTGFDGLMNARSEFDALFGNVRAALGSAYVFFAVNTKAPVLKKVAFVKFDDIDKPKRKTLFLSLVDTNTFNVFNPSKKEYNILVDFAY
ncbi:MAG: hypothetical protein KGO81_12510 [Bacteroidota bacterium]|nr:hypothetical protein [Bacteroidota bacterium]